MICAVCGEHIGGRGDRCPNNGLKWHNKTHKERYQRQKWGGPLNHWDDPWSREDMRLIMARLFDDMKDPNPEFFERHRYHLVTHELGQEGHLVRCEDCLESVLS